MNDDRHHDHDVIVVGARCAGAATAMLLARAGLDVVMVDRAELPSDTLSTHSIARSGVVQLHRWGLLDQVLASGAPAIRDVVFHLEGQRTERTIKAHAGVDFVVAPRRYVLDGILADAAVAAGASLRTGIRIQDTTRDEDGRVTGVVGRGPAGPVELRARVVVGADGVRSKVARAVEAPVIEERPPAGATHYAYYFGPAWPANEYYLGNGALSGIFPTNDGHACVWVCLPAGEAKSIRHGASGLDAAFDQMLVRAAPDLADRLIGAVRATAVRGAIGLPNHIMQAAGPGWALVGDAGYHRDPITGHGISDAFRDAELLADAIAALLRGDANEATVLAAYQHTRDEMLREIFEITCALGEFPATTGFIELQRQLSHAIDTEAAALAGRPSLDVALAR